MNNFGQKLKNFRELRKLSQSTLAKEAGVHHTLIGKYERDEVNPTIDVVIKLATALQTTVGILLGETEDKFALQDTAMIERLNYISQFEREDKKCIIYAIDAMINNVKLKAMTASMK